MVTEKLSIALGSSSKPWAKVNSEETSS